MANSCHSLKAWLGLTSVWLASWIQPSVASESCWVWRAGQRLGSSLVDLFSLVEALLKYLAASSFTTCLILMSGAAAPAAFYRKLLMSRKLSLILAKLVS